MRPADLRSKQQQNPQACRSTHVVIFVGSSGLSADYDLCDMQLTLKETCLALNLNLKSKLSNLRLLLTEKHSVELPHQCKATLFQF